MPGNRAEPPPCLVCGSNEFEFLFSKESRDYWRCPSCDLEEIWPLPAPTELVEYYDTAYRDGSYKPFVETDGMLAKRARSRPSRSCPTWTRPIEPNLTGALCCSSCANRPGSTRMWDATARPSLSPRLRDEAVHRTSPQTYCTPGLHEGQIMPQLGLRYHEVSRHRSWYRPRSGHDARPSLLRTSKSVGTR